MYRICIGAVLIAVVMLSGCVAPKSYVDPSFSRATYEDLQPVNQKHNANIVVEFQRNGEIFEKAHTEAENQVLRSFRATGVINPVDDNTGVSIKVIVNNVADTSKAVAKGFGTGLTLGLAGSVVTDYYEISIEYSDENGVTKYDYKHALHTTVGNKKAPIEGVNPTSMSDGFGTIIEETILNFVKDMQDSGLLTMLERVETIYSALLRT